MSYQGLSTSQLTPELLQQMQDYQTQQKQQAMAQALMAKQANPQTPYAGVSNAGGDIAAAIAQKQMQQNAMQQAQNNVPGQMNQLPGGNFGSISTATPKLPNQGMLSGLSGLFGMGGS